MQFFEKPLKMWENIGILNFSQQKKEKKLFGPRTKLLYYQLLTIKFFTETPLAIEMKKLKILMNKPIYLVCQY